jgi:hypothetical protein
MTYQIIKGSDANKGNYAFLLEAQPTTDQPGLVLG